MSDDELLDTAEGSLADAKQAAERVPDQLGHEGADAPVPPLSATNDPAAAEAQAREADPSATPEEDGTGDGEDGGPDRGAPDDGPADDAEQEDPSVGADSDATADDADV